jgi:hypothetical protein
MNPFKQFTNTQQRIQPLKINIDVSSINEFPELVSSTTREKIEQSTSKKVNYAETTKKVHDVLNKTDKSTNKGPMPGWTQLNYDNVNGEFLMVQSPEIANNKNEYLLMESKYRCNIELQNMVDRWTVYLENFIEMHGEELYLRTYTDYYNSEYYEFEDSEDNDEYYCDTDINADTDEYDGYYD